MKIKKRYIAFTLFFTVLTTLFGFYWIDNQYIWQICVGRDINIEQNCTDCWVLVEENVCRGLNWYGRLNWQDKEELIEGDWIKYKDYCQMEGIQCNLGGKNEQI